MAMAYLYLAMAIVFEVIGTITMKYSEGFTKVLPVIMTVICHGICFVALAVALKSLPVSLAYAIWAGVGTAIMALIGLFMFNEPLPIQKVLATSLIIAGVVMLNFADTKSEKVEQVAKIESSSLSPEKNVVVEEPTSPYQQDQNAG
ncbi:DMT family transporter [Bdellovibrio reynosensis]|uniref:Multidrug efflux SMR transporter n=1 Tax=Bdellovibrio reynosensis TaxID=2835041 RepID=A0ABY4CB76_9BACT|nr:multidrug efflux SMR transporter [Bdellovibrio reynosensis]UOF02195.1 multidrug efflux SMR transporter [Bdellovibrio reynosensis]